MFTEEITKKVYVEATYGQKIKAKESGNQYAKSCTLGEWARIGSEDEREKIWERLYEKAKKRIKEKTDEEMNKQKKKVANVSQ